MEPWRAPYARSLWHLPFPAGDLDDLTVGPLRLRCLEDGRAYGVVYDDGDSLRLDLRYDAAAPAHEAIVTEQVGHLDQLCHVTGVLETGDSAEPLAIDCFAVRDRSWYVRRDQRSMRAGYTYGAVDADEHFLVFSRPSPDDDERYDVHGGYLVRHGRAGRHHERHPVDGQPPARPPRRGRGARRRRRRSRAHRPRHRDRVAGERLDARHVRVDEHRRLGHRRTAGSRRGPRRLVARSTRVPARPKETDVTSIPIAAKEITPAWLSEVLGAEVAAVEVEDLGTGLGLLGEVARLRHHVRRAGYRT